MKKALTALVAVLLMVIVAQWFAFSRVRRENQMLLDARTQAEQARSELEAAIESTGRRDTEAQSLRTDLQNDDAGWSRWEKSTGGNGHYYKAVAVRNGIAWMHADKLAREQGGYLATIASAQENAFVFELINSPKFFADFNGAGPVLGGFQPDGAVEPDGGWQWVTGEPWTYTNWHSGEPNNAGPRREDGLIFFSGISKTPSADWGDIGRTDSHTKGYVIERDK